jgi:hypothetical protein
MSGVLLRNHDQLRLVATSATNGQNALLACSSFHMACVLLAALHSEAVEFMLVNLASYMCSLPPPMRPTMFSPPALREVAGLLCSSIMPKL